MYSLKRLPVWLSRIRHCRGFGVQSPWTYSFICDVVNEHNPYYSYEKLKRQYPGTNARTRRLCELYLRIANFMQADNLMDFMPESDIYMIYMAAGCKKIKATSITDENEETVNSIESFELARMSLHGNYRRFYRKIREKAHDGSMLIVQGIKRNKEAKRFWQRIVADKKCTITLDLYYCGIIYFDSKRYKQKYTVNF